MAGALVATGCNAILGIDDLSLRDGGGGSGDASAVCYGTLAPACFAAEPTGGLTLSGDLNTATDPRCSAGPVCAIGANSLVVDGLVVTGPRPLALVAITTLTVAGKLDASSSQSRVGAGANAADCTIAGPGGLAATPGGGAGGSFGTRGGTGGRGATMTGALGGTAGEVQQPTTLRGGCPGGAGGGVAGTIGTGGSGGGAVSLYAVMRIQIDQSIRVIGAGGRGGISTSGGGGGGGSGGMIILEAPIVIANSDVYANGGGGGEGANDGDDGMLGGESGAFDAAAPGGKGSSGGDGGNGFARSTQAQSGMTMGAGAGGGGGGGGGVIWIKGTLTGTRISPAPVPR